jgi:hypothetical protein
MCEPAHSIVQIDINKLSSNQEVWVLNNSSSIVDGFAHVSFMGCGHHEAIKKLSKKELERFKVLSRKAGICAALNPCVASFEYFDWDGNWWNGTMNTSVGRSLARKTEFEPYWHRVRDLALMYHENVCTGNLKIFRRFMEESLRHSQYPQEYLNRLPLILTDGTWHVLLERLKSRKLLMKNGVIFCTKELLQPDKEKIIATVMPFLRRISNFKSEFVRNHSWSTAS